MLFRSLKRVFQQCCTTNIFFYQAVLGFIKFKKFLTFFRIVISIEEFLGTGNTTNIQRVLKIKVLFDRLFTQSVITLLCHFSERPDNKVSPFLLFLRTIKIMSCMTTHVSLYFIIALSVNNTLLNICLNSFSLSISSQCVTSKTVLY